MLELYHSGLTQASVKVRLTLKEKGLDYKSHFLRLPAGDHLTPEYLAINPDGQVPALVDPLRGAWRTSHAGSTKVGESERPQPAIMLRGVQTAATRSTVREGAGQIP